MGGLLDWLRDSNNRSILAMLGSVLAFLWTAGFGIYVQVQSRKDSAEQRQAVKLPARDRPQNKRRQPRNFARIISVWAVGLLGGAALWYALDRSSERLVTTQFVVCGGEYESECPAHNVYIYCYLDPDKEAEKACKTYKLQTHQTKGGNKCGYHWNTYPCTNDAP